MNIELRKLDLPDFGQAVEPPQMPAALYENRCRRLVEVANCDWLVVYGDREHYANLAYLTGFDPRFEEALLLLGPADRRVLVVGNEGLGYLSAAKARVEAVLAQSLSLMGQDRSRAARLGDALREAGIAKGQRIGVAGWKYLEPDEWTGDLPGLFAPALLIDLLRSLAGDPAGVVDATPTLMHPVNGLRSRAEAEQIAAYEWAATRATLAVRRIVEGVRPGLTELEAASRMGYAGEPLSAYVLFASGKDNIVGLRSPSSKRIERGDGITTAIGYWGGLSCRAGLVDDQHADFVKRVATPYFQGLASWYETARLGVAGGAIYGSVQDALAEGGLRSTLNPGHLTGLDEWVHTPVRPGSLETLVSGMVFQCDIIPEPVPAGWAINCEDPVVFANEALRNELRSRFPEMWARIYARQEFMRTGLGLNVADDLLPLSATPAYLAPLWLAPDHALVRA